MRKEIPPGNMQFVSKDDTYIFLTNQYSANLAYRIAHPPNIHWTEGEPRVGYSDD